MFICFSTVTSTPSTPIDYVCSRGKLKFGTGIAVLWYRIHRRQTSSQFVDSIRRQFLGFAKDEINDCMESPSKGLAV
jgi:hypothetical protein